MVEAAGGALAETSSPHLESTVVAFVPPEAVEVCSTGSDGPLAETVNAFDSIGVELDAAAVHLKTYTLAPLVMPVDSLVPFALGRRAVTAAKVTSALRLAYWLVPAFQDTQSDPTFFASAAVKPKIVVSPEESPLT
jgi:hypothetical protein